MKWVQHRSNLTLYKLMMFTAMCRNPPNQAWPRESSSFRSSQLCLNLQMVETNQLWGSSDRRKMFSPTIPPLDHRYLYLYVLWGVSNFHSLTWIKIPNWRVYLLLDFTPIQLHHVYAGVPLEQVRGGLPGKRDLQGHLVTIYQWLIVSDGRGLREARRGTSRNFRCNF